MYYEKIMSKTKHTLILSYLAANMKYAIKNYKFDYIILMDADGEDRPVEIIDLINKAKSLNNLSVVAKRVKRSEGTIFKMFYTAHKILTFIFTGKLMNFGNFSIITKKDTEKVFAISEHLVADSHPLPLSYRRREW